MGSVNLLAREQQATSEFLRASAFMRDIADDRHSASLLEFTDSVILAIAEFGTAELHARHAERMKTLKLARPRAQASAAQQVARHQKKGFALIACGRKALDAFRRELADFPTDLVAAREIDALGQDLRESLVDVELKASDVEKVDKVIGACLDEIRAKGAAALPGYLGKHLAELERLRKGADRGAVDNIPVWKVAAIAVAVGVFVWALFRCRWWGSCSLKEGLAYAVVFWIAALIARYC